MRWINSKFFTGVVSLFLAWMLFSTVSVELEKDEAKREAKNMESKIEEVKKNNQILEKLILESIGVDVKLPWRGKEREYALHKKFGFRIPIDGDPFLGIGDYEVVKRMLTWQDYIVPKGPGAGNPISNLPFYYMLDSYLNNVRISRLPIGEFLQLAKKDKSSSHHKPQNHRQ